MFDKKENSGFPGAKAFLLIVFSSLFLVYAFLTVQTKLSKVITVNIPLYPEFPIPVFFWCGVFIYVFVVGTLFKADFRKILPPAVLFGLVVNFVLLILDLNIRNEIGEISWFSPFYLLYFKFILYTIMLLVSITAGALLEFVYRNRTSVMCSLLCPMQLLFIYAAAVVFRYHDYALFIAMLAIFSATLFISGKINFYLKFKEAVGRVLNLIFDERIFLPLVFIVSMAFRVVFLKRIMTNPDFINTASDGGYIDGLARDFLAGKPARFPGSRGYWMFLAGVYAVFGTDYFRVGIIQSIFGSAAVILTYLIAKRGFGVIPARIAAIAAALDYPLIFSAVGIGHEAMDIFYGVLIVFLLIKCSDLGLSAKGIPVLALTGVVCALAMATREVNMLMPLVGGAWLVYAFSKLNIPKFKVTSAVFILLLFSTLALSPFLYLNCKSFGSAYEQSSTYGIKYVLQHYNPQLTAIGFNPAVDLSGSMQIVIAKPLVFLRAVWTNYYTKFMELYFSQGYGGFDPIFLVRKPVTNYYLSMWFYTYLLTFTGIICVFFTKAKDRAVVYLILLIILYKTAFHLFTISVYRYRAAIEPFIIMFASSGIYLLIRSANKTFAKK